jgi:hypothetical protein
MSNKNIGFVPVISQSDVKKGTGTICFVARGKSLFTIPRVFGDYLVSVA